MNAIETLFNYLDETDYEGGTTRRKLTDKARLELADLERPVLRFRIVKVESSGSPNYPEYGVYYNAHLLDKNGDILVNQFRHGTASIEESWKHLTEFASKLGMTAEFVEASDGTFRLVR